ncbi:MAG: dynamin family protein [bacterium]|nr:dynamin family protein [bacterium]
MGDMAVNPEKASYIEKIETQVRVINNILKMDSGTVISSEVKKLLRNLQAEAEIVLRKLKNNEFEVAIVGLEKAGKSTFANALMENDLLPTKDLRCTFTSTQIEYSGDDKEDSAIVSFYTAQEFDRDFKDKLSKLGIPNAEQYSFDTISEANYLRLFDNEVSDDKKRLYSDSIHEDILAIIRNVDSLSRLLGTPPINFGPDRINSGDLESYITEESKARAVKQVVIRSKKLNAMKNAVIFDVPGFNSPTELHKIQTLERMKSADAIIVIANGASPSLTGESLSILRQSDDDGNPLNDKLFVFANKIDQASDIGKNIQDTRAEWINKGFVISANQQRIVFGSARAHLQAAGLDNDRRVLDSFNARRAELPDGDGIEAMRSALAKYNDAERFEVLKRRINRINADITKAFSDICSGYENTASSRSYSPEQVAMALELVDDIRTPLEKKLLALKAEIRSSMPKERPLSQQIIDYITAEVTAEKYSLTDEELDDAIKRSPYVGTHEDVGRIEGDIREQKFKVMYDDFSVNVVNIADKLHHEYSAQILEIMLSAMGIDSSSPYYEDLKNELTKKIKDDIGTDLRSADHSNELYYQSLIERFSRYIYQVLITSQYSFERLREFYDSIDDLYSLSIFYKKPDCENKLAYIDVAPKDQPLCMMLLFHHYFRREEVVRSLVDEVCRLLNVRSLPEETAQYLDTAYCVLGSKERVIAKVRTVADKAGDKSDEFKINMLNQTLYQLINKYKQCSVADKPEFEKFYGEFHNSIRNGRLSSVADLRADFDVDIQILQDVLINAFVRAISMEKPFVAREVKAIDDIVDFVKSKKFGAFISANFYKIKYRENQLLDKQRREQEQNAVIIGEISHILNDLVK